jgi:hypothetical protein
MKAWATLSPLPQVTVIQNVNTWFCICDMDRLAKLASLQALAFYRDSFHGL